MYTNLKSLYALLILVSILNACPNPIPANQFTCTAAGGILHPACSHPAASNCPPVHQSVRDHAFHSATVTHGPHVVAGQKICAYYRDCRTPEQLAAAIVDMSAKVEMENDYNDYDDNDQDSLNELMYDEALNNFDIAKMELELAKSNYNNNEKKTQIKRSTKIRRKRHNNRLYNGYH